QGPRYRFQQLMKYLNYVTEETDFPIAEFQSRTSMASQAIGYGKWLMVVHMLRRTVGDAAFLKSLREFFRLHLFKKASFQDLRKVFERVTGRDLRPFFDQWVRRTGAPVLQLTEAVVVQGKEGAQELEIQITQKQHGPLFVLDVPIALWDEDSGPARVETVRLKERDQVFRFPVSSAPRAVMLDPWYDLFRRLDRREAPPSLGQTYGAERAAVLVSREEPSPMTAAYRQFGAGLGHPILEEAKVSAENLSLWVLGRSHPMARLLIPWLREKAVQMQDGGITIEGQTYDLKTHSVVLTVPHPDHPARAITWLMANTPAALRGLLRKLPHYGKYGFLVFAGDAPSNVAKGVWPAARIGLMRRFHSGPLPLPARPPLVPFAPTP
ncbi:MAG: M1 family aminopeptidase, partial [Nitrospinaceae bacterium]